MERRHFGGKALFLILLGPMLVSAATVTVEPGQRIGDKIRRLRPGDILLLKSGTHRESLVIDRLVGTKKTPIWIRGEPGAVIVPTAQDGILFYPGRSSYVVVEGLRIENARRAGILVSKSDHVLIRNCVLGNHGVWGVQTIMSDNVWVENCEIYGSKQQHGIYFSSTDHPIARGNRIHDNRVCGIHNNGDKGEGGDGMITGGIYENNVVYNNGKSGAAINLDGVEKSVVHNNLIYDNLAGGITSFHGDGARAGSGNVFSNNTVYFASGKGRFGLQITGGGENNVVTENILVCSRGPAIEIDRGSLRGLRSDHNLLFRTGSSKPVELDEQPLTLKAWQDAVRQDLRSVAVDPKFLDASKADFHLPVDSPAAGMGYR